MPSGSDPFQSAVVSDDEEDWEDYVPGGYHPVRINEAFADGRYTIVRKLGWGHFSTVWLARDQRTDSHVALKVVRSAPQYSETARDEITLLMHLHDSTDPHPGRAHVVALRDHFTHAGPNGEHVCMVFDVLGANLLGLVKRYQDRGGVPVSIVKQVAAQTLAALDYMHRCRGLIHTDIKPENILLALDDAEGTIRAELAHESNTQVVGVPASTGRRGKQSPTAETNVVVGSQPLTSLASDGAGGPALKQGTKAQGNFEGRADIDAHGHATARPRPETMRRTSSARTAAALDDEYGKHGRVRVMIADLGNATWSEDHFTEDIQTRQYRCPEVILGTPWGASADIWSLGCVLFEILTGGDYLYDPEPGPRHSKDDDHLAQIVEIAGHMPKRVIFAGRYWKQFFNRRGELRRIRNLRCWPIDAVLREKYAFSDADATAISAFLVPMLELRPEKRASAGVLLRHPWLRSGAERKA